MQDFAPFFPLCNARSWWWDCAHGGTAEGLIEFCKAHTNIVTRVSEKTTRKTNDAL